MTSPDPLAVAAMVAYCGWDPTVPITDTIQLDGNDTGLLTLPSLHVTDVTAVNVTDQWGTTKALTVAPAASPAVGQVTPPDVTWSDNGVILRRRCGWPAGQRNVQVTYSGGYDGPPDDLAAALDHLGARIPQVTGATSQRLGTAAVTWASTISQGGLLLIEQMVFDRYRLPKAA